MLRMLLICPKDNLQEKELIYYMLEKDCPSNNNLKKNRDLAEPNMMCLSMPRLTTHMIVYY